MSATVHNSDREFFVSNKWYHTQFNKYVQKILIGQTFTELYCLSITVLQKLVILGKKKGIFAEDYLANSRVYKPIVVLFVCGIQNVPR